MQKWMKWIDVQEITLTNWLIGSAGILIIRFFFESLSSRTATGILATDFSTLVHYALFYFGLSVSLLILLAILDPDHKDRHPKLLLFGLPIIWLPPLVDLTLFGGMDMAYIFAAPAELFNAWLTFFGPKQEPGITLGIRLEVFLVMIGVAIYFWQTTRNFAKTLTSPLLVYSVIFLWVSLPSVFAWLSGMDVFILFFDLPSQSIPLQHIFHPGIEPISAPRAHELIFNAAISQAALLIIIPLVIIYGKLCWHTVTRAVWRNKRPWRIVHYLIIGGIGLAIGTSADMIKLASIYDYTAILFFALAIIFAWFFAVGVNDLVDVDIDAISNKQRPLVTGSITSTQMKHVNTLLFILMLLCGYLAGHHALFAILTFTGAYYIYSAPPLRLKRIPIVQSLLVAFATVAIFVGGFFLLSTSQTADLLPIDLTLTILFVFTLVVNVKDLKDIDGDRAAGISTLPVMLGMEKAQQLIGTFIAGSFLLLGWMLEVSLGLNLIFAVLSFLAVQKTPYDERRIFGLYFLYVAIALILHLT